MSFVLFDVVFEFDILDVVSRRMDFGFHLQLSILLSIACLPFPFFTFISTVFTHGYSSFPPLRSIVIYFVLGVGKIPAQWDSAPSLVLARCFVWAPVDISLGFGTLSVESSCFRCFEIVVSRSEIKLRVGVEYLRWEDGRIGIFKVPICCSSQFRGL
jgi:hypothetical protein